MPAITTTNPTQRRSGQTGWPVSHWGQARSQAPTWQRSPRGLQQTGRGRTACYEPAGRDDLCSDNPGLIRPNNNSRTRGYTSSAIEPRGAHTYRGAPSLRNACLTAFFEHPIARAITLIYPLGPTQPPNLSPILRSQHPLPPDLALRPASSEGVSLSPAMRMGPG